MGTGGHGEHVEEGVMSGLGIPEGPCHLECYSHHKDIKVRVVFLGYVLWTTSLNRSFSQELVEMQSPCPDS